LRGRDGWGCRPRFSGFGPEDPGRPWPGGLGGWGGGHISLAGGRDFGGQAPSTITFLPDGT
jgi:hypothetical protein